MSYASDSWFSKPLEQMTKAELDAELGGFKAEMRAGRIDDTVLYEVEQRLRALAARNEEAADAIAARPE